MVGEIRIYEAAALIGASQNLVVLTGAGVSKESGVPTFRDSLEGLWSRYDPQQLATAEAFVRDPKLVWDWYEFRRGIVRHASPNLGHFALVELESMLPKVVTVTQNVDDLHQRAGSTDILPLHGAIMQSKCFRDCREAPTIIDVSALTDFDPENGPPRCPYCGAWVRPDVVWFGENLSLNVVERAFDAVERADVVLTVGTSGVVQPAATLPFVAHMRGVAVIDVNPKSSAITDIADIWLQGPSGEILPQLVAAIQERIEKDAGRNGS